MAAPIKIFIGTVEYTVTTPGLSGAQIKTLGEIPSDYQLFLEQPGDDLPIQDGNSINLTSGMHFYGLPAATFGL
jgi:hypothetical protein